MDSFTSAKGPSVTSVSSPRTRTVVAVAVESSSLPPAVTAACERAMYSPISRSRSSGERLRQWDSSP